MIENGFHGVILHLKFFHRLASNPAATLLAPLPIDLGTGRRRCFPRIDEEVLVAFEFLIFTVWTIPAGTSASVVPSRENVCIGQRVSRGRYHVEGLIGADAAGTMFIGYGAEGGTREQSTVVWVG